MNNNQKGLWTVLIIVLVILIIWGIVAAYNRSEVAPADQGLNATSSTDVTGGGANNGNGSNGGSSSNANAPVITSLTPSNGRAGVLVTVNGARFTSSNNQVTFGGFQVANVTSSDTNHLSFTIPDSIRLCNGGNCSSTSTPIQPGAYNVTIINPNGASNQGTFVVTSSSKGL